MLESFLVEGRQDISGPEGLRGLVYGQSVTDACMSWETTEPLLHQLADAVRSRRRPVHVRRPGPVLGTNWDRRP